MNKLSKTLFSISLALLALLHSATANQDTFVWAADLESGAPHAFNPPWDMSQVVGMDTDLARAIARELNKTPIFVNNTWDALIPGLNRNLYDAVVGGVEITPEHEAAINLSIPYFITFEQLVVHQDSKITDLDECEGLRIGALKSSVGVTVLESKKNIEVVQYATEINAFMDIASRRLDGFLIDAPIAMYYANTDPLLKLVGKPEGEIKYAVAIRDGEDLFTEQVNSAIRKIIDSGELRQIIASWNMWNPQMAEYTNDHRPLDIEPVNYQRFVDSLRKKSLGFKATFKQYLSYLPALGKGALVTIEISIISMLVAILLGFVLAIARIYGPKPIAALSRLYIEIVRGTPLLIQLYFIFYGLPSIGVTLDPFTAGVVALGLNYAAFEAENYRAGILSVHQGQMEAARALGMTHWQGLKHVVIPQAFHVMLPPVTNDFISLLKDSSLVSVITIVDLTFAYSLLSTTYYNYFGIGIVVAIIYLLMGLPFVQLARWAEKRLRKERRRVRS